MRDRLLLLGIDSESLKSFLDLKTNHGELLCFPWLVAHHVSFFKYPDFRMLELLLKYRRGFNVNIGSKMRKKYFSDVKSILTKNGMKLTFVEDFRLTEHYHKTETYSACVDVLHNVIDSKIPTIEIVLKRHSKKYDLEEVKVDKEGERNEILRNSALCQGKVGGLGIKLTSNITYHGNNYLSIRFMEEMKKLEDDIGKLKALLTEEDLKFDKVRNRKNHRILNIYFNSVIFDNNINLIFGYINGLLKEPTQESIDAFEKYKKAKFNYFTRRSTNELKARFKAEHNIAFKHFLSVKHFMLKEELLLVIAKEREEFYNERLEKFGPVKAILKLFNEAKESRENYEKVILDSETFSHSFRIKVFEGLYYRDKPNTVLNLMMGIDLETKWTTQNYKNMINHLRSIEKKHSKCYNPMKNETIAEMVEELKRIKLTMNKEAISQQRSTMLNIATDMGLHLGPKELCLDSEYDLFRIEELLSYLIGEMGIYQLNKMMHRTGMTTISYNEHNVQLCRRNLGIEPKDEVTWKKEVYQKRDKKSVIEFIIQYREKARELESFLGISHKNIFNPVRKCNIESFLTETEKILFAHKKSILGQPKLDDLISQHVMNLVSMKDVDEPKALLSSPSFIFGVTFAEKVLLEQKKERRGGTWNYEFQDPRQKFIMRQKEIEEKLKEIRIRKDSYTKQLVNKETIKSLAEARVEEQTSRDYEKVNDEWKKIKRSCGINFNLSRKKIETEHITSNIMSKVIIEQSKSRLKEVAGKIDLTKNKYYVLHDYETIEETSENVKNYIMETRGDVVNFVKDMKRYRNYTNRKNVLASRKLKKNDDLTFEQRKKESENFHSMFCMENNSNANKKYNIKCLDQMIKHLVFLSLIKVNPTFDDYTIFGLKKCQYTYALKNLSIEAVKIIKDFNAMIK